MSPSRFLIVAELMNTFKLKRGTSEEGRLTAKKRANDNRYEKLELTGGNGVQSTRK